LSPTRFTYIDDGRVFAAALTRWQEGAIVAIDTEFIRTRTFYPIAALYQIATESEVALLDPLRLGEWGGFKALLEDPAVVKVMHASSEDLEVFARHLDAKPNGLFDTQIAAGFLGTDFSPSYATLVRRYTGVEIEKHETRSDWLARPLRDEQLEYAVADVEHLLTIYRAQSAELQRLGRSEWCGEEMRQRIGFTLVDPEQCYSNLARAWRCDERQLGRLKALCAWRERYARERDLPRGRVIKDDVLIELACARSVDRDLLLRMLDAATVRRHGRELLAIITSADAQPENELPARLPPPLTGAETATLRAMKTLGAERARELDMAEELLSRRRDLEACLRSVRDAGELPTNFRGWRWPLVGETFAAMLQS
jgi:ribonuclease D